jgi:hypothetical protein
VVKTFDSHYVMQHTARSAARRDVTAISLTACREKVQEAAVYIIPASCQSAIHPAFGVRLSVRTVFRSSVCCYPFLSTGMRFTVDPASRYGASAEGIEVALKN